MDKDIFYHRYTLVSAGGLNSNSTRVKHEGVLLRVNGGYGCVHPWPELGDGTVELQLEELRAGRSTPLIYAALKCAEIDAQARRNGVSLFENLEVPLSHATIVGGIEQVESAVDAGFTKVKIKVGRDVEADADFINQVILRYPQLVLRLDFNCKLLGSEVEDFVAKLSTAAKSATEFLEDPCGYKDQCWVGLRSLYGIRLALDIGVEKLDALYSYAVIKPAKNDTLKLMKRARAEARKTVVTSYMDHPLGQAYAAYSAGVMNAEFPGIMATCGLMTHGLFEANAFTESLGKVAPEWSFQDGTGLGFDELLEDLEWTRLS